MTNILFEEYAWKAKILWTNPLLYHDFLDGEECLNEFDLEDLNDYNDEDNDFWVNEFIEYPNSNFYMILGQWNKKNKIFYIGKTIQEVIDRVKNTDHKKRKKEMETENPKHKLLISLGDLYMESGCNKTSKRIDDIESLLIYAHEPEYNKNKIFNHTVESDYWIKNYGYTDPLYKQLHYGLKFGD